MEMEFQQNIEGTANLAKSLKPIGISADHGGFALKEQLIPLLKTIGYDVKDFGAYQLNEGDDYPDFVIPMAKAVAKEEISKGIAICGSGVGACIAANKVTGIRSALITDSFSAHQGVEDDNMNIMCLGGNVTGQKLAWELVQIFLDAKFKKEERFVRRLDKVALQENKK
jgi:ribose 5-phosphate isomerase B